jgi:cyanate lyase
MAEFGSKRRGELAGIIAERIMEEEGIGWTEFGESLGLERSFIVRVRLGQRKLGAYSMRKMAEAYPKWKPQIDMLLAASDQEVERMSL